MLRIRSAFVLPVSVASACYRTGPPSEAFHPFLSSSGQRESISSSAVELYWDAPRVPHKRTARISVARPNRERSIKALRRLAGDKGCDYVVDIDFDSGTQITHMLWDQMVFSVVVVEGFCAVHANDR